MLLLVLWLYSQLDSALPILPSASNRGKENVFLLTSRNWECYGLCLCFIPSLLESPVTPVHGLNARPYYFLPFVSSGCQGLERDPGLRKGAKELIFVLYVDPEGGLFYLLFFPLSFIRSVCDTRARPSLVCAVGLRFLDPSHVTVGNLFYSHVLPSSLNNLLVLQSL